MSVNTGGNFTQYVQMAHQRAQALYNEAREFPWQQPQLVLSCLEELEVALEELHMAEEALHSKMSNCSRHRTPWKKAATVQRAV